ncbi:Aminotransferase [Candidatus Desulfarcum epimagneticum]|uniref:GDP-perosamine synthase n=1 Tax=uncultured Desulfobacteraceae bacterium TaxID=218296 RepID=A0A484HNJ1_9BACT|nr:Aminotransferase [uncultured Desulfobacteraceae bacterium]
MFDELIVYIRKVMDQEAGPVPLHEPIFSENEKKYLLDCIDSTFVSSVGRYVDRFEDMTAEYSKAKYAIATVNGTAALHVSLLLSGVQKDDEVITQALTFVATANAISYTGAKPVFIDVDQGALGLSPESLSRFLSEKTRQKNNCCVNKSTGKRIKACVPTHTFGHPCRIDEIKDICDAYHIVLIEDASESLGSFYKDRHTGTFGTFGVFSFNGNKIVTTGGGGMIVTDDKSLAQKAKHITTTAKRPHKWEYVHDQIAYNYRLPNLNAALGCAQMERLPGFLENKRRLAKKYENFFSDKKIEFIKEPEDAKSNYWLNAIVLENIAERDRFLEATNEKKIMTRPAWRLLNRLEMYKECQTDNLANSKFLEDRMVNLPSSVILNDKKD